MKGNIGDVQTLIKMQGNNSKKDAVESFLETASEFTKEKPDSHPLSEAYGDVETAISYCDCCSGEGKRFFGKPHEYRMKAIEKAGDAVTDIRNYELNTKGMAKEKTLVTVYKGIKELTSPFTDDLDQLRDYKTFEKFLKDLNENNSMNEIKKFYNEIFSGKIENDYLLKKEKSLAIQTIENVDTVFIQLLGKGTGKLMKVYKDVDREKTLEWMKEKNEMLKETPEEAKAYKSIDSFIGGCPSCKPGSESCKVYRNDMEKARSNINKLIDDNKEFGEDVKKTISYFLELGINFLSNMTDEEFDEIKDEIAEEFFD